MDASSHDQSPSPSALNGQVMPGDVLWVEDGVRSSSGHRKATGDREGVPTMIDSFCWSSEASPKGCKTRWHWTSRGSRIN